MWVENPDIEVGFLEGTAPYAICGNVKAGSCLGVCSGSCQYFTGQRLKFRLDAHLVAHFSKESGRQVPYLIVPD